MSLDVWQHYEKTYDDTIQQATTMFDDLLKLIKNSPRWAQSSLARRLGFSFSYGHSDDDDDNPESVEVNGVMYVFGGYNEGNCHFDLYAFNLVHHHWTKLDNRGGIVPGTTSHTQRPTLVSHRLPLDGRASHAWCGATDDTKLYLFGGSGPHWGQTNMGKLLQYSLLSQEWSIVATTGTHPPPGYGQSLVSIRHKLYLFGGTSGHVYVNDLYVFDEVQLSWALLPTHGVKPSPRYKHQAVVVGTDMYIVGGGLYDPPKGSIDMHKFDTITSTWSAVVCRGDIPCSRIAHTVSVYPSGLYPQFQLFGGRDETGMRLNELSCFDVATSTWSRRNDDSNAPDARDFHTSAISGDCMFVFGGSNGDERNSDVFRYSMRYTPSTLALLAIQTIQKHARSNRRLQRQLRHVYMPMELHAAIDTLNTHVRVSTNEEWYPLPFVTSTPPRSLTCRSRSSSAYSSTTCEEGGYSV
ncbi:hypothetical protein DYB35_004128 [Aphanomyces astaci]|uniref:Uncharacterized protein n=2 Tax=Aphanomyces astaci TaxID=112090 RepID=A0A397FCJ1_APHAT|nr:hypothetical protein DYB34_004291 [Aphanomyces astaci]RHY56706.1 hypothetical protein DYB38_001735 [Aphanomyces astaci]RHY97952.1 hypothetical protein DYB35_004128 [Aphanomyces astaci]RHZ17964.1 hypothetical protein DYB31_010941 [Aphanomyces astaci]